MSDGLKNVGNTPLGVPLNVAGSLLLVQALYIDRYQEPHSGGYGFHQVHGHF